MRFSSSKTAAVTLIAGLALGTAACGGGGTPAANNASTFNTSTDIGIGNDASAMETIGNAPAPAAPAPATNLSGSTGATDSTPELDPVPLDSAPGGDTGGNGTRGVESNVSGM